MVSRSCSIIGWHGRQNLGDDAFLVVLVDWAAKHLGVTQIDIFGVNAQLPALPLTSGISVVGREPARTVGPLERRLRPALYYLRKDYVIYGGGSLFRTQPWAFLDFEASLSRILNVSIRGARTRPTFLAIGVTLSELPVAKRPLAAKFLRRFRLIAVRDDKSLSVAEDLRLTNVVKSHDLSLVFPLKNENRATRTTKSPLIGISVVDRDTEFGRPFVDERKRRNIAEALALTKERWPTARVRIVVVCKDRKRGDEEASRHLLEELTRRCLVAESVEYQRDVNAMVDAMRQCDAVICNRMHAFVFCCLAQIPAIMIGYDDKMFAFADRMDVSPDICFSHSAIDSQVLAENLCRLIVSQEPPCAFKKLESARASLRDQLSSFAAQIQ